MLADADWRLDGQNDWNAWGAQEFDFLPPRVLRGEDLQVDDEGELWVLLGLKFVCSVVVSCQTVQEFAMFWVVCHRVP